MKTVAIGGTSGKSTTTAMIFHILQENKLSPSLITGAGLSSLQKDGLPGNAFVGESDILVIEADESDGSIVSYHPSIGILLNIDRDHKEFDELLSLFSTFKSNTKDSFIVNEDYALTRSLKGATSFGTKDESAIKASNFIQNGFQIQFDCNGIACSVPVIGKHNMENACAAIAASLALDISIEKSAQSLASFEGIYRRTQVVGSKNNIVVIDDFAHNPAEVKAAIKACQQITDKVIAWFQPHGYGPLRFMYEELIAEIADVLRDKDFIYMSDVYYAGGTVNKDINSDQVIEAIKEKNKNAVYIPNRDKLKSIFKQLAEDGTVILLMGARDPGLEAFAKEVLDAL